MIVILSLTLPAVAAGGLGEDEAPEDPVPTPEDGLQQLLDLLASLGLIDAMPASMPLPDPPQPAPPGGPDAPPTPEPPAPSDEDPAESGGEEEDEGDEQGGGGGGMNPNDPTGYVPCAVEVPERERCGDTPDPEEDPQTPEPEPGQQTPETPRIEDVPKEAERLGLPVESEDESTDTLLGNLLAPVQAAARSATDGAKVVIAGVVTTAGFVAQEATEQAHRHGTQIVTLITGVANWSADTLLGLLGVDATTAMGSEGEEVQTQSAEAGVVDRPVSYVTLGLIAVGSLGLIALAFGGLRRLLGLGGVALLSRIPSKDIMKNDTRAQIFEIVQSDPGVSLNEIVDRLGLSRNAIAYHLAVFESEKQVVSVKDGKYRRYFVNGGKYVNGAKDVVSTIKNDVTLNVIRFILDHPGAMQKEVCTAVGTSPSATNWHINRLEKVGLVEKEKVANTVRYSPGPSFTKYDLGEFGLAGAPTA